MKPCEHCGLGDLALSDVDCRWSRDGVPPCALDEAEQERLIETRHSIVFIVFTGIVIFAILMAGYLVSVTPR